MMNTNSPFLRVENLQKTFGQTPVLKNISFQADEGEFVTLLGPSGCGKSTLLRCLAGLEKISCGKIHIADTDVTYLQPRKRNIGMVFQNYALFPNMTAIDNILFGLKISKVPIQEQLDRGREIIELVDLKGREQFYPDQLSGGQKQRVALGRSLIMRPQLLLLDEPFSALDAKIRKSLRQQVRDIQKHLKLTTIFVTHDQQEALIMSDNILLMNSGIIEQKGDGYTIYSHPKSQFVADFIGEYNYFSADIAEKLLGIKAPIAIRPESIYFFNEKDNDSTDGVQLNAEIINITFYGSIVDYTMQYNNICTFNVQRLNRHGKIKEKIGDTIVLWFDKASYNIFTNPQKINLP